MTANPAPQNPAPSSIAPSIATALHERVDEIRTSNPDLPSQLRDMADELPPSRMKREMERMATQLQSGSSSAEIARRFPDLCWILTMNPGSATADALAESLSFSVVQTQLQRKRLRAIAYPCLVTLLSVGLFLVACVTIVPIFDEMFQEFELKLPGITLALVNVSRFVVGQPFATAGVLILVLGVMATVIWLWVGDSPVKRMLIGSSTDRTRSRHSFAKAAIQVAELTEEGIGFGRTLQITAASSTDIVVTSTLSELAARQQSEPAGRLVTSRPARALPQNLTVALFCGDQLQPNPTLLRELAASYRELAIDRRDWSAFIIAQLALILVGILIAFMVISLFLPLISLMTSLSS